VVSAEGKGGARHYQVRVRKTNENELLMTCRKYKMMSKLAGALSVGISVDKACCVNRWRKCIDLLSATGERD
jgi:hypothetical protein